MSFEAWINDNDTFMTIVVVCLLVLVLICCIQTMYRNCPRSEDQEPSQARRGININAGNERVTGDSNGNGIEDTTGFIHEPIHVPEPQKPVDTSTKLTELENFIPPPSPPPVYKTPKHESTLSDRSRVAARSLPNKNSLQRFKGLFGSQKNNNKGSNA